jgi:hypothetical protein
MPDFFDLIDRAGLPPALPDTPAGALPVDTDALPPQSAPAGAPHICQPGCLCAADEGGLA